MRVLAALGIIDLGEAQIPRAPGAREAPAN
jgi:hypothetical protein